MTAADILDRARHAGNAVVAVAVMFLPLGVLVLWRVIDQWMERGSRWR